MTKAWQHDIDAERRSFRHMLTAAGFTSDGTNLRGPLPWNRPDGAEATATIEITLTDAFPFGPPQIKIIEAGVPLIPTFHRSSEGVLCLWPSETEVETAPWRDPPMLLRKVAGWLRHTDAGWPGDTACDLERYLPNDPRLVLYDANTLVATKGCVRTRTMADGRYITITSERQQPPSRTKRARPYGPSTGDHKLTRKQQHLAWVTDIGHADRPIEGWASLETALGDDAGAVGRLIASGAVEFVLARYRRADAAGVLAMAVRAVSTPSTAIEVRSCEAADTSMPTRILRAGPAASELARCRAAVIGVGAVGSFVADLLFRHGVRNLTLIDGQLLRPGNVIRHLAGDSLVGHPKPFAVKCRLHELGFDTTGIDHRHDKLATPEQAIDLVRKHDVVIDASADPRATALLAWASHQYSTPVISVCVEREGAIVRVDRFPLRGAERHLPPVRARTTHMRIEHGCDDPVSLTPPVSVMTAAQLAFRVTIDELTRDCTMPATLLDVIEPQEEPYDVRGISPPRASHDDRNPAPARRLRPD